MFDVKGAYPIIQFAYRRESKDIYLDVRLIKRTKARGFVILTCNGGNKGFIKALRFIIKNKKKLIRIIRGIRKSKGLNN